MKIRNILEQLNIFNFYYDGELNSFKDFVGFENKIIEIIKKNCVFIDDIIFSKTPNHI